MIKHYDDVVHCSMVLFNEIASRKLHNTHKGKRMFVDIFLNVSKVIEDTTWIRQFIKGDER